MSKIIKAIKNPKRVIQFVLATPFGRVLTDKQYLKISYRLCIGKKLNLEEPRTFNEKLQWLKLNDRKKIYTQMVDKCTAKKLVADMIGEQYIIPTIAEWDSFDEIDFEALPDQFVLKCNHDSGGLVICTDKSKFDIEAARKKINKSLKTNYYWKGREWPYKNVKPRIIAEQYMEDKSTAELRDYKFFCFNGEAKVLFIATDRQNKNKETAFDFFDLDYKHLPIKNGHPFAEVLPEKPRKFDEMVVLAEKLSTGIPHVRVDFYEVDGKIFFGELTFFQNSGMVPIEPEEWDYMLGDLINLPKATK